MVKKKYARVTNDFCRSKHYKVRMVLDDYPYVQEVFSTNMYDKVMWLHTNQYKNWYPFEREGFEKLMMFYSLGLGVYTHMGGDFDYIFDLILENSEFKTSFILDVLYFVSIYKMFKAFIYSLGLPQQFYNLRLADIELTVFIPLFYFHILAGYLINLENKGRGYKAHGYDLLSSIEDPVSLEELKKMFNNLTKKFIFTDVICSCLIFKKNVSRWLIFLDEIDNQDLKKAVGEVKKAEANIKKYQKLVFNKRRR